MGLSSIIEEYLGDVDTIMCLICYQLTNGSAMYNCKDWLDGNSAKLLFPNATVSSQSVSKLINKLGHESIHRKYFKRYIEVFFKNKHGILIDSTALPSTINTALNSWGYSSSGIVHKINCLMLVDQQSKLPIFFRAIPGEIADVSTLQITFEEIHKLGLNTDGAIFDAGYFSEDNVKYLCDKQINFVSRMPKSRLTFKELVDQAQNITNTSYAVKYGKRVVFIKSQQIDLFGHKVYAHIILDLDKKAKDINKMVSEHLANPSESTQSDEPLKYCGFFILISRQHLDAAEVLPTYYTRQTIEQIFGFAKTNNLLPLRIHSEQSINGYLLLVFLSMIIFVQVRQMFKTKLTPCEAFIVLRNWKAKVYEKGAKPLEASKKVKDILALLNLTVPISMGI